MTKKFKLLGMLPVLIVVAILIIVAINGMETRNMQIICGPYLQNVTKNSMTIMWQTDKPGTSVVEYERAKELGWSAYVGRPEPTYPDRAEDDRAVTIHAVTLEGLDEQWTYSYRVRSVGADGSSAVSEGAVFRTAAADDSPFSFATYGDDMRVHKAHKRSAELARAYRATICVGAGDVAQDVIGRYKGDFFDCTHELLKYTPWFAAMGNHDSPNEGFFKFFSFPEPRYWYSFNYGCAHFVVINSNMDYRPGSEQWAWLEQDLRKFRDARWKFVVLHHPPFCSNNCEIPRTRVLCPLFEKYGVDIVYAAHATIYERFHPITGGKYDQENGVVYFVSGGGGYDMSLPPSQFWDHIHPFSAMNKSTNHFLLTHVAPGECSVRAIDNDDRVIDTLTLSKPPGELLPLSATSPRLPYPQLPEAGTVVAGLEEGDLRWVLPRPQYTVDAKITHGGGHSVRWSNNGSGPVLPAIRRVIKDDGKAMDVAAGKRYEISAWVKTQDVSGEGVTVSLSWSGDMGFVDRTESKPLTGTNDWTLVKITTPPLYEYVYWCRVVLSAKPGSTGTAWFDEVLITPTTPAKI